MSDADATLSPILQALQRGPHAQPAGEHGRAGYCAQGQLPLDALGVEVTACGALARPLGAAQAEALQAASSPAPFGHREATVLDKRVRDTGRITAADITLHWAEGALAALQAEVAQALGQAALELRLHDLLVYGPGQFFKPHQDTEKHPGMVGTLVLVWPSAHIGGTLAVQHGADRTLFASQHLQAPALRWCAFYADCRHEVLPVEEGWRVVLSFDLVVPAEPLPRGPAPSPALLQALRDQLMPGGEPSTAPWVFLLEHEYSQHGLRWNLLKGDDRAHVQALAAAAAELGLVAHLALAEIHESWTAIAPDSRRGRYRSYDDDDDDDDYGEGAEPDELIDDDMLLDFWVDARGRVLQRAALRVRPDAAESFFDTGEDYLVGEEYEGYMGNYGETLDYWYRRAALVLQTPQAQEASRFTTEFDAALHDAVALARGGQPAALAERLRGGWRELQQHARGQDARRHLAAYAELAAALPDAERALELCRPFDWTQFTAQDGPTLALLAEQRGAPWLQSLFDAWTQPVLGPGQEWRWAGMDAPPWPQDLDAFVAACPPAAIAPLLQGCEAIWQAWNAGQVSVKPARRHELQARRLQQAAQFAAALQYLDAPQQARALQRWADDMHVKPSLYPLLDLPELLQNLPAAIGRHKALDALREAVVVALQDALKTPELPAHNHRLDGIEWQCRCGDCSKVIAWAQGSDGAPLTLAMAEGLRSHVEQQLKDAAAPLRCETLRQGRPYKLVIHKPADLHATRQARRAQWARDLAALQS